MAPSLPLSLNNPLIRSEMIATTFEKVYPTPIILFKMQCSFMLKIKNLDITAVDLVELQREVLRKTR